MVIFATKAFSSWWFVSINVCQQKQGIRDEGWGQVLTVRGGLNIDRPPAADDLREQTGVEKPPLAVRVSISPKICNTYPEVVLTGREEARVIRGADCDYMIRYSCVVSCASQSLPTSTVDAASALPAAFMHQHMPDHALEHRALPASVESLDRGAAIRLLLHHFNLLSVYITKRREKAEDIR